MKMLSRNMASRLFTLLAALALVLAHGTAQAEPAHAFPQQELDRMLAPIALYPDALLTQILMASTYPLEVVEAARWSRARPGLSGDEAVRAAQDENWDPSVKSLLAFPQVLARMDENLQWTQSLGDAFLDRQAQVMDTVQALRRRAEAAGNLNSDERVRVVESGPSLLLQPVNPQIVYVPYYDPMVVYGSWWWPAYAPVYWRPWPGYYARPGYASGFYFGPPIGISVGFFFGAIDWPRRQVRVVRVNNSYFNSVTVVRQTRVNPPGAWHHDPDHRRGVAYHSAGTQQRIGGASAPSALPDRGSRTDAADTRRVDSGANTHPNARNEQRASAARPGAAMRADARPPAAARTVIRIEPHGSSDARPEVSAALPPASLPQTSAPRAQPSAAHEKAGAPAVATHEPVVVHREAPRPSVPSAQIHPAQVAARQETGARVIARPTPDHSHNIEGRPVGDPHR